MGNQNLSILNKTENDIIIAVGDKQICCASDDKVDSQVSVGLCEICVCEVPPKGLGIFNALICLLDNFLPKNEKDAMKKLKPFVLEAKQLKADINDDTEIFFEKDGQIKINNTYHETESKKVLYTKSLRAALFALIAVMFEIIVFFSAFIFYFEIKAFLSGNMSTGFVLFGADLPLNLILIYLAYQIDTNGLIKMLKSKKYINV